MNKNNNRKLIGTIIGVIFFVILIAGATFAWLTYTANVNNGVYNYFTQSFMVDYFGSNDVSDLPILSSNATFDEYDNAGGSNIQVLAAKNDVSGTLYLKLHIDDNDDSTAFAEAGCIRYAVFKDGDFFDYSSPISQVASDFDGQTGVIDYTNMDSSRDVIIYTGPLYSVRIVVNRIVYPTYNIYLWIDNEYYTDELVDLDFSGYIHGYAVQNDGNR